MTRFTKNFIKKVLEMNEGFTDRSYYKGNNSEEENFYSISNGKLIKRSVRNSSWSDSRQDSTSVCDEEQTRRFLKSRKGKLKLD